MNFILFPILDIEEQKITGFGFNLTYKIKGYTDDYTKKNIHILKRI